MLAPSELETQLMLLTRSKVYLRRMGVKNALERRLKETWHSGTIQPHWAATIGLWGGVATHTTIMKRAGVNYDVFKQFRARNSLITRSSEQLRTQHNLALDSFLRWQAEKDEGEPKIETVMRVASHFGILPIELRVYVDRMEQIVAELGITAGDLLVRAHYDAVEPLWTKHSEDIDTFVASSYAHVADDG